MTEFLFLCRSRVQSGKEVMHRIVYRAPTEDEAKTRAVEHLAGYGYTVLQIDKTHG